MNIEIAQITKKRENKVGNFMGKNSFSFLKIHRRISQRLSFPY